MIRVRFSQTVESGRDAMDVPVRGPGMRGGSRDESVAIMLRRDTTVRCRSLQLLGQSV